MFNLVIAIEVIILVAVILVNMVQEAELWDIGHKNSAWQQGIEEYLSDMDLFFFDTLEIRHITRLVDEYMKSIDGDMREIKWLDTCYFCELDETYPEDAWDSQDSECDCELCK